MIGTIHVDLLSQFPEIAGFLLVGLGAGLVVGAAAGTFQFVINWFIRFIKST